MMNPYLKNLQKIEFVLTWACSGACKHCSQGDHPKTSPPLDDAIAVKAVRDLASVYPLQTVLVFGGEPLLYAEKAARIIEAARDCGIPQRQIITNGYFSADPKRMAEVAHLLAKSGVNDLLLSVDAFHQESIPAETVRAFALFAKSESIPLRLQPAWLKSPTDKNPYNQRTCAILESFRQDGFAVGEGNLIFPEGNAKTHLASYFTDSVPANPYVEDPKNLFALSVDPDGDLLHSNLYQKGILDVIDGYKP